MAHPIVKDQYRQLEMGLEPEGDEMNTDFITLNKTIAILRVLVL